MSRCNIQLLVKSWTHRRGCGTVVIQNLAVVVTEADGAHRESDRRYTYSNGCHNRIRKSLQLNKTVVKTESLNIIRQVDCYRRSDSSYNRVRRWLKQSLMVMIRESGGLLTETDRIITESKGIRWSNKRIRQIQTVITESDGTRQSS